MFVIHSRARRVLGGLSALCVLGWHALALAQSDNAEALSAAARKGDAAAVKKLLDAGADVNTRYRYERTALSFAADRGHLEVVNVLLERGADQNIRDTFYNSAPLLLAISPAMERTPQHDDVVRAMLKQGGIKPDILSDALAAATRTKRADLVKLLEEAGAKPKQ